MEDAQNEYILKATEELALFNVRIGELEAMANKRAGEARRTFKATLSGIRESRDQAQRHLDDLRVASEPAWNNVKQGVEQARKALSKSIDRASERCQ